jgi:hypothetical protein
MMWRSRIAILIAKSFRHETSEVGILLLSFLSQGVHLTLDNVAGDGGCLVINGRKDQKFGLEKLKV